MVDLVKHISDFLKLHQPKRLVVACSGGLDSTVLLHICKKLPYPVEIAHVNYQLRGEESEGDQQFIEKLAKEMRIPIHVKRVNLKEELKDSGNLQQIARYHRYDFFEEIRSDKKAPHASFVLLGHHKEDQTETFFMNLARNSGVLGLAGMEEASAHKLRPLLAISKKQIEAYALENNISWREDSSNQSLKYTRNEWRNVVLPELRKEIPGLDEAVYTLTKEFQRRQWEMHVKISELIEEIETFRILPVTTFEALDDFEQVELCRQLGVPIGMLETWRKLSHKGTGISWKNPMSNFGNRLVFDGDSYAFVQGEESKPVSFVKTDVKSLPDFFDKQCIYVDSNRVSGELRFRPIQTGDRIHPIGMTGSRLVSDVISDAKLTSREKQMVQILVDEQHVLWVPNLCVSRMAIASNKSKKIVKISLD